MDRPTVRSVREGARDHVAAELRRESSSGRSSSSGVSSIVSKQKRGDSSQKRTTKKKPAKKSSKEAIEAPLFHDVTGVPLNAAARSIVEKEAQARASADDDRSSSTGEKTSAILSNVPDVKIAPGKNK
jgi:hypothetical protein